MSKKYTIPTQLETTNALQQSARSLSACSVDGRLKL